MGKNNASMFVAAKFPFCIDLGTSHALKATQSTVTTFPPVTDRPACEVSSMNATPGKACIGVDVGGTNLRFALVADDGSVLLRERRQTEIGLGRASFFTRLLDGIAMMRSGAERLGIGVGAAGIGVPGLIDNSGLVLSSVNLQAIEGANITETVQSASGLPVITVNDANAAAFGENSHGAGRDFQSLLLLTLGTGVGSGLILNGALWTGIDGVAAEYGHATVEPQGLPCGCGNRGCLEQYASATALVKAAARALENKPWGALSGQSGELTAERIAVAALEGDRLALSLYETAGRYLGIAAATIANLLNIEAIILGGGVAGSFELLAEPMQLEMMSRAFPVPGRRLKIVKGELGDDAGILGAAALAGKLL